VRAGEDLKIEQRHIFLILKIFVNPKMMLDEQNYKENLTNTNTDT